MGNGTIFLLLFQKGTFPRPQPAQPVGGPLRTFRCEGRRPGKMCIRDRCLALLAGRKQYDCLVLADKAWHQGVVGIVASRLAEQYACPVFMICLQDDGKGKGRCV